MHQGKWGGCPIHKLEHPENPGTKAESGEEVLKTDCSGNQPIAAHERSLKLTTNPEPEQAREPLRGEPVRTRGRPSSRHSTLLEEAGSCVQALGRALAEGAQRGEGASGVGDDPKAGGHGSSRPSTVQHMGVGSGLGGFHFAEGGEGVSGLGGDVRVAQGVAHHVVGVVVDVLVARAVDIEDVGAPLVGGAEPGFHLDVVISGRLDRIHSRRLDQLMSVANFFIRGEATGMSMGKVTIADATGAVGTSIRLVRVVGGSRRDKRVDQNWRSGEAQQLGEQQVAPQPSGEVVRLDHQRSRRGSGEERKEGIRSMREHARVTGVASRVLQALERKRMGSARQVPLQFAWRVFFNNI